MFSNPAVDIFIGLIFTYLLYSLLVTILQELIAGFLNLRAVVLVKGIRVMLEDRVPRDLESNTRIGRLTERVFLYLQNLRSSLTCTFPNDTLAKAFYKHPSIKYLSSNVLQSKPSYINANNFSATMIRVLRGRDFRGEQPQMEEIQNTLFSGQEGRSETKLPEVVVGKVDPVIGVIEPETLDHLQQLYIDAKGDLEAFRQSLESWFDQTMDRANGWYRRSTRKMLFIIGLVVAIWGNVDTLKIYDILSKNNKAREQLVEMAIQSQTNGSGTLSTDSLLKDSGNSEKRKMVVAAIEQVQADINTSNQILAMGWHESLAYYKYDSLVKLKKDLVNTGKNDLGRMATLNQEIALQKKKTYDIFSGFSSIVGWTITALALTLGAPFWFDLLNKVISIRYSGVKPGKEPAKN